MTRKSKEGSRYPDDWKAIATAVKDAAGWRCVRCDAPHSREPGRALTVHHLDMDPANSSWWNLAALCAPCHLQIQHRVVLERPWVFLDHTEWFKPYVGGYYAHRYLDLAVTREQVEDLLPFFVAIERDLLIGGMSKAALVEKWKFLTRYREALALIEEGAIVVPTTDIRTA